jgi:hypothetical protein
VLWEKIDGLVERLKRQSRLEVVEWWDYCFWFDWLIDVVMLTIETMIQQWMKNTVQYCSLWEGRGGAVSVYNQALIQISNSFTTLPKQPLQVRTGPTQSRNRNRIPPIHQTTRPRRMASRPRHIPHRTGTPRPNARHDQHVLTANSSQTVERMRLRH